MWESKKESKTQRETKKKLKRHREKNKGATDIKLTGLSLKRKKKEEKQSIVEQGKSIEKFWSSKNRQIDRERFLFFVVVVWIEIASIIVIISAL